MPSLTLTQDQLYELNDAVNEVLERMLRDGQDATEIRLRALPNLWEAFKAVRRALLDTFDGPGMQELELRVLATIANPMRKA